MGAARRYVQDASTLSTLSGIVSGAYTSNLQKISMVGGYKLPGSNQKGQTALAP